MVEEEIRKKTQGFQEKISEYIIAIQTLMRRHGGSDEREQLERIYENLRPEYKLYIRRRDFNTLPELMEIGEEFEVTQMVNSTFLAPPTPSQSLVPETAFAGGHQKVAKQGSNPPARSREVLNAVKPTTEPIKPAGKGYSRPAYSAQDPNAYRRENVCWNCGTRGHLRRHCKQERKLFCSHCGKTGVLSRACTCQNQGNEDHRLGRKGEF